MKTDWQRDQGAACGCGGADDMCPCQNVISADYLFGRLRVETTLDDMLARAMAKVLSDAGMGMEAIAGRSAEDITALATVLRRIKAEDDFARIAREADERAAIWNALCAVLIKP